MPGGMLGSRLLELTEFVSFEKQVCMEYGPEKLILQ